MGLRLDFHTVLSGLAENVYYDPPNNVNMQYPAIVYEHDYDWLLHSDNKLHSDSPRYLVTVIDSDPDSEIADKVKNLPMSRFVRHFVADQLHHIVYNVYS